LVLISERNRVRSYNVSKRGGHFDMYSIDARMAEIMGEGFLKMAGDKGTARVVAKWDAKKQRDYAQAMRELGTVYLAAAAAAARGVL
jgi:hypothetical protein